MKIVVIGGSGLIGSRVVNDLRAHGHEAVAASPNSGVNTLTGEGLAEVVEGASVVVDVSNSPSFEEAAATEFFETSTRNLLTHEAAAGVSHHVALSVVGTERLSESGYMRAKIAQERLIKESPIPYSIVHSTQFFEFFKRIADDASEGDTVRLAPVLIQPIGADDVARAIGGIALGAPAKGTVEIAGPEQLRFDSFIRQGLRALDDPRKVVTDPHARYFGAELSERTLVAGDEARLGETRFEDWLQKPEHLAPISSPPTAAVAAAPTEQTALEDNEFHVSDVPPGSALLVSGGGGVQRRWDVLRDTERVHARPRSTVRRQARRVNGDVPVARLAIQRIHGRRGARAGEGCAPDVPCDREGRNRPSGA